MGVLSRPSEDAPAPTGVLDEDSTPAFSSELRIEEILAGTTGAVEELALEVLGAGTVTD